MKHHECPFCGVFRDLIREAVSEAIGTGARDPHKNKAQPTDLLSDTIEAEEAAQLLHIARQTLYSLTSRRKIPFYKQGKKILFRRSELVAWLKEGRSSHDSREAGSSTIGIHYPVNRP